MTLKDLIKDANEILGLAIDWDNTATDENYRQLFACARLVLNTLTGVWNVGDNHQIIKTQTGIPNSVLVYGILTEYAFVAGMFNEWKVWHEKYKNGIFGAKNGKSRIIKI